MRMKLRAFAVLVMLVASTAQAEPRIDISTDETMRTSTAAIKASLTADEFERFRTQWTVVMQDLHCPADTEKPNIHTMLLRGDLVIQAMNGKSVADVSEMAAKVENAKEAERASMRELPIDSEPARKIRTSVETFLGEAPEQATHYMEFSRFWTAARTEIARKVVAAGAPTLLDDKWPTKDGKPPPSFSVDSREMSASLMPDGWMKKLKVTRIIANDTKAYVDISAFNATLKATFLKEADGWKSHADFLGFPWSREGTRPPECVGVLQ